jgi:hypothetical protein
MLMDNAVLEPMKKMINNMAVQLGVLFLICSITYVAVFLVLRFLKVPKVITNFLASISFLVAFYYAYVNGYIPGLSGSL